ncbi:hypothetical protein ACJMK2_019186 [Sinanodonta woodiana]|uniref:Alpha/beta hydrolase fold-3 domain-containing protein n=1 Tax=Sinanodonta woodiana TaxID=1069815 RepID=A0ABD3UIE7_SINWO
MHCYSPSCLFLVAMFWIVVSYYLYTPFPDTAKEPWKQSLTTAMFKLFGILSSAGETLQIDSATNISRKLMSGIATSMYAGNPNVQVEKLIFDGVDVILCRPANKQGKLPGLVYFHGGGWVFLNTDSYRPLTDALCESTEAVVVSVEYRLAPENIYPAAFDDCVKSVIFFLQNAVKYNVDMNKIGIAGDSVGGNLAMAVALKLSNDPNLSALPRLAVQGLIYPPLQFFNFRLPSYIEHGQGPSLLTSKLMAFFALSYMLGNATYIPHLLINNHTSRSLKHSDYSHYVSHELLPKEFQSTLDEDDVRLDFGDEALSAEIEDILLDPYFAPLMATDAEIKKLPPACIVSAEIDPLRDDSFLAAKRMAMNGIWVRHDHYPGYGHGFFAQIGFYEQSLPAVISFCKCLLEKMNS